MELDQQSGDESDVERGVTTRQQVRRIFREMIEAGEGRAITVDTVRKRMGGGGGTSTITEELRRCWAELGRDVSRRVPGLPEAVSQHFTAVWQQAMALARKEALEALSARREEVEALAAAAKENEERERRARADAEEALKKVGFALEAERARANDLATRLAEAAGAREASERRIQDLIASLGDEREKRAVEVAELNERLKLEFERMDGLRKLQMQEVTKLRESERILKEEVAGERTRSEGLTNRLSQASRDAAQAQGQLAELARQAEALRVQHEAVAKSRDESQSEVAVLRQKLADALSQANNAREEVEPLRGALRQAELTAAGLAALLDAARADAARKDIPNKG